MRSRPASVTTVLSTLRWRRDISAAVWGGHSGGNGRWTSTEVHHVQRNNARHTTIGTHHWNTIMTCNRVYIWTEQRDLISGIEKYRILNCALISEVSSHHDAKHKYGICRNKYMYVAILSIKWDMLPATLCIPVSVNLVLLRERVVRVAMDTTLATPTSET